MNKKQIRTFTLLVSSIGAFLPSYLTAAMNVALPTIGSEFLVGPSALSWINQATLLAVAISAVPMGKISDIVGNKKVLFMGTLVMIMGTLIGGLAPIFLILLIGRAIQGIGAAMVSTTVVIFVFSSYDESSRGKTLGINLFFTYLGITLGPLISGILLAVTSWRAIFFSMIILQVILLFCLRQIMPIKDETTDDETYDVIGTLLYAIGVFLVVYGLTNLLSQDSAIYLFIGGLIILLLFILYETKTPNPIIDVRFLIQNKALSSSLIISTLNYSSTFSISYLMSFYLQTSLQLSSALAGFLLLIQPAFQAIFSPLTGSLSDKKDPMKLATVGMLVITIGLFAFSFFTSSTSILVIVSLFILMGIGYALFSSPITNIIMSSVEPTKRGIASGLRGTSRTLGQSFSTAITAIILFMYLGDASITVENASDFLVSFQTTFIVMGILSLMGIILSLIFIKKKRTQGP